MTDISAIMTGHKERLLVGPALASFNDAIGEARSQGLAVESILVLDRPDALTRAIFEEAADLGHTLVIADGGDPGLSRNRGVQEAKGDFVAFLDADDLWSSNWLVEAHKFCSDSPADTIGHSEVNLTFGEERVLWVHADSRAADFDIDYQRIANYWDAMAFGARAIYLDFPFIKNELALGYGHEDWYWNNQTLEAGIHHRPVPGTIHMKRRRKGSQMAKCAEYDVVVRPSAMTSFSWEMP